jgi:hypothetical protein
MNLCGFHLKKQNKNSDSLITPMVNLCTKPGSCFSFPWALQEKVEFSKLILFDRLKGEPLSLLTWVPSFGWPGQGQGYDAYIYRELKVHAGDRHSESFASIHVLIFIEAQNFIWDTYFSPCGLGIFPSEHCNFNISLNTLYLWYWQNASKEWKILF